MPGRRRAAKLGEGGGGLMKERKKERGLLEKDLKERKKARKQIERVHKFLFFSPFVFFFPSTATHLVYRLHDDSLC